MVNPFEQWFRDVPPITKIYSLACLGIAVSIQLRFITPLDVYYHPSVTFLNLQVSLHHLDHLTARSGGLYQPFAISAVLELISFFTCFSCISTVFLLIFQDEIIGPITGLIFLGSPLTFMMVYLWSQKNPDVLVSFLGLFIFTAPYLPWVLLGFSLLLFNSFPMGDFIGIVIGHLFYYLDEIYPATHQQRKILVTPLIMEYDQSGEPPSDIRISTNNNNIFPENNQNTSSFKLSSVSSSSAELQCETKNIKCSDIVEMNGTAELSQSHKAKPNVDVINTGNMLRPIEEHLGLNSSPESDEAA